MNDELKNEFLKSTSTASGKITFTHNEAGHITHVVRREEPRLFDIYSRISALRCVNLPHILDISCHPEYIEVSEEYIRGDTLNRVFAEQGTFSDAELLRVATDVCRALAALHSGEPPIIHRDVKPSNIMRHESGNYVLIDFGAARMYREDAGADTKCVATVGYAAPEQYGLSQTDVRSDLFSLGVTLYELKTGKTYSVGAKCDGRLKNVIAKCTAFDPKKRYKSAMELLAKLKALSREGRRQGVSRVLSRVFAATTVLAVLAAFVFASDMGAKEKASTVAADADPAVESAPLSVTSGESASNDTSSVKTAVDYGACTCILTEAVLTTDKGLIVSAEEGLPMTIRLTAEGVYNRHDCIAKSHIETVPIYACSLSDCSIGAHAEMSDDGALTVYEKGVYIVSCFVDLYNKGTAILTASIIVTDRPAAYTECKCVFDPRATRPSYGGNYYLPEDGSLLICGLSANAKCDARLCTASEHIELWPFSPYIEYGPDVTDAYITDDMCFSTTVPGTYSVMTPVYFKNELFNIGATVFAK